ncbi:hypothetical protein JZ751_006085 [Albula glossodonta]|uniref:Uncharacterized protein n=1 Tax=Albula glossodonta TaxID=121402 RepID=A0A8T2PCD2_9TELE|nr:hypothetical protein JZ751_006085 [Albula glossodonta]
MALYGFPVAELGVIMGVYIQGTGYLSLKEKEGLKASCLKDVKYNLSITSYMFPRCEDKAFVKAGVFLNHLWVLFPDVCMVIASEIAVDVVKHAFITKFNDITADVSIQQHLPLCVQSDSGQVHAGRSQELSALDGGWTGSLFSRADVFEQCLLEIPTVI